MRYIFFILLCSVSLPGLCQDFTIGGYPGTSIFIGLDNLLEIPPFNGKLITAIEGPANISIKGDQGRFIVHASAPSDRIWIKLFSGSELVDSIKIKSERLYFKQFSQTENFGLITPGSYPKKVLQDLKSIVVKFNVPWVEAPVIGFEIIIYQDGEVLYHSSHRRQS
ncbi:MAG: hypothetical protein IPL49_20630 [Saprospirales bacterium]|nr:hypothetical protein [Saprospirales bacterium]